MATLWMNKEFVLNKTAIDSNVDWDELKPAIEQAQDLDILPLLGSDLYNAINTHIEAFISAATPIPAAYKTLLDSYILKALPYYALSRCTPTFKFKYTHKGVMVKSGENAQSADTIDIQREEDRWNNIAQEYAARMIKYLQYNSPSFPEYYANGEGYKIPPRSDAYECPIYLGPDNTNGISEYYNKKWIDRGY